MNLAEYARMYEAEERQWWYAGMRAITFALLRGVLPRDRALRLLDAGCGTGNMLFHLAEFGHAVGIDLSPEALRFCRTRGVTVARASVLSLPFREGSFDCVTSFDVLYHRWVEDDTAAVAEMVRVLAPGGVLLLRVPALELLRGAHDEAVHSRHRYTRGEVRRLLTSCGLTLVSSSYANSVLFPVLLARRTLDRWTGRTGSDVEFLPAPLEKAFFGALRLEAALIPRLPLPMGASIFAVATKAGGYNPRP